MLSKPTNGSISPPLKNTLSALNRLGCPVTLGILLLAASAAAIVRAQS